MKKPIDLRPGDMMYRAPYPGNPVGHIRIIDDVQKQDPWVVFNTAEARGDDLTGPTTRWWRYPQGSSFARLEEYVGDAWRPAEDREQADVYSRRLPTRTSD